jgi:hypothetical protein
LLQRQQQWPHAVHCCHVGGGVPEA